VTLQPGNVQGSELPGQNFLVMGVEIKVYCKTQLRFDRDWYTVTQSTEYIFLVICKELFLVAFTESSHNPPKFGAFYGM